MKYMILLHLTPVKVELPIKVKGEEAEKTQSGFDVEYHIYRNETGEKVKEDTVKGVLEVEVKGIVRVNPSVLARGLVLTAFVEKGLVEKRDNLLVVE